MHRDDESPAGRTPESEAFDLPQPLGEIERRLKRARPRPPRLDAAALVRQARAAADEPPADRPAIAARRRRRTRVGRRFVRRVALAGSCWACGALVGALAMFVALSNRPASEPQRGVPPSPAATAGGVEVQEGSPAAPVDQTPADAVARNAAKPDSTAVAADHQGPPASSAGPSLAERDPPREDRTLPWSTVVEPFAARRPARRSERLPLRAGTRLEDVATTAADPWLPTAVASRDSWSDQGPRGDRPLALPSDYVAPAAVTREHLLEDVLRDIPGVAL